MDELQGQRVKISVIIPARDEEANITACIESLKGQDLPADEIIVVDNGSTDRTAEIAETLGARVVFEPRPGLPRARETGREAARGELLVYVDADMILPTDYLGRLLQFCEENQEVVAVSNPYLFYDGDRRIRALRRLFFKVLFPLYGRALAALGLPGILFGGNFAVRRDALDKIGGFDTSIEFYGEDADLSKRIAKVGRIGFIEDLFTSTSARRYMQQGIIRTQFTYFANYLWILLFGHPFSLPPFRVSRRLRYATAIIALVAFLAYGFAWPTSQVFGKVEYRLNTRDKEVALTFDDGPNGLYTDEVLAILQIQGIPATFFLIGRNVEDYPDIAREIVEQGYCIGNHSYTHAWYLPFESKKALVRQLSRAEEAIQTSSGASATLFRPPRGLKSPWMISAAHQSGYRVITWTVIARDYVAHAKAEAIARQVLKRVRPGSIIVLHDGLNLNHTASREQSVHALQLIIDSLREQGYSFVSLCQ